MKPAESLRLRSLRAALELSQGEFAAVIGVGRSTIARSELGAPVSSGTIASIAHCLRVDPTVIVDYFAGKLPLDELTTRITFPKFEASTPPAHPEDAVPPGRLADVAAAVFRGGDYGLDALDAVRAWLKEIEASGDAAALDDAEAAEQIAEQLFEVAASFRGTRMSLSQALLRACVRLSYLASSVPEGTDPKSFIQQRRAKIVAAKVASTRERHRHLIESAKKIYDALPDDERQKLGYAVRRFVNGDMHDGDPSWVESRETMVKLGASSVPF